MSGNKTNSLPSYRSYYSLQQRIKVNSKLIPESGCWLWSKACEKKNGYGVISVKNKQERAHRTSFVAYIGPIPNGMLVCHHCDTPACVNPNHLFIGTFKDNNQDSILKKRHRNNRKTHCLKGHPFSEKNTIVTKQGERNCRMCKRIRRWKGVRSLKTI